ncbi:MAG: YkgJ family cysteine cluster protein [Lysobacter sp.]|nr:YkgJ family cysteine cluster protein [Lysobacter sp.]
MPNKEKRARKLRERRKNSIATKQSKPCIAKLRPIEKIALQETVGAVVPPGNPILDSLIAQAALPAVVSGVAAFEKAKSIKEESPVESVKAMLAVGDKEIAKGIANSGETPACGSGCNYCCQNMRIVFCEDEAVIIAEAVARFDSAEKSALSGRLEKFGPTGSGKGVGQCALLGADGRCSIYDSRPMSCRAYHSTSRQMCKGRLDGSEPQIAEYTTLPFPSDSANLYSFWTVLGVRNSQYGFEMNSFLSRILKFDGRLEQWANGVLLDESDMAATAPKDPSKQSRKVIPLVMIQEEATGSDDGKHGFFGLIRNVFGDKK